MGKSVNVSLGKLQVTALFLFPQHINMIILLYADDIMTSDNQTIARSNVSLIVNPVEDRLNTPSHKCKMLRDTTNHHPPSNCYCMNGKVGEPFGVLMILGREGYLVCKWRDPERRVRHSSNHSGMIHVGFIFGKHCSRQDRAVFFSYAEGDNNTPCGVYKENSIYIVSLMYHTTPASLFIFKTVFNFQPLSSKWS